jgi:hypothetical protein
MPPIDSEKVVRFSDLKWTVYSHDDPDIVFAEHLTGSESNKLMDELFKKGINAVAINEGI